MQRLWGWCTTTRLLPLQSPQHATPERPEHNLSILVKRRPQIRAVKVASAAHDENGKEDRPEPLSFGELITSA